MASIVWGQGPMRGCQVDDDTVSLLQTYIPDHTDIAGCRRVRGAMMKRLANVGFTHKTIGVILGCSASTVCDTVNSLPEEVAACVDF